MTATPNECAVLTKLRKIVRLSIQMGRREEIDAVIAPAERAGKFRHRHHLDHGDSNFGKFGKLFRRRLPRPFRRKRADMQFVNDLPGQLQSAPRLVGPFELRTDRQHTTAHAVHLVENAMPDRDKIFPPHQIENDTDFPRLPEPLRKNSRPLRVRAQRYWRAPRRRRLDPPTPHPRAALSAPTRESAFRFRRLTPLRSGNDVCSLSCAQRVFAGPRPAGPRSFRFSPFASIVTFASHAGCGSCGNESITIAKSRCRQPSTCRDQAQRLARQNHRARRIPPQPERNLAPPRRRSARKVGRQNGSKWKRP